MENGHRNSWYTHYIDMVIFHSDVTNYQRVATDWVSGDLFIGCICIYTYIYIYIYTYIHTYPHTHTPIYIYIYIHSPMGIFSLIGICGWFSDWMIYLFSSILFACMNMLHSTWRWYELSGFTWRIPRSDKFQWQKTTLSRRPAMWTGSSALSSHMGIQVGVASTSTEVMPKSMRIFEIGWEHLI